MASDYLPKIYPTLSPIGIDLCLTNKQMFFLQEKRWRQVVPRFQIFR
jgi:hypothetical protein